MLLREKFYKDELKYHLGWQQQQQLRSLNKRNSRSPNKIAYSASSTLPRVQMQRARSQTSESVPVGALTVRSKNTPTLSRREKLSMLNITSKIMSATVIFR